MKKDELTELLRNLVPESEFPEGTQLTEVIIPAEKLVNLASELKSNQETQFDYLINHTAVDYPTHIMLVYHLDSTKYRHLLVVKVKIEDRENPVVDSLSEIYPASEFFEREVFDLFGVRYNNHPNLKRLFMEDGYGFPLRKDFRDEVNIIER
jgi:NADH:ubiquinone oxidoreductase subunit C